MVVDELGAADVDDPLGAGVGVLVPVPPVLPEELVAGLAGVDAVADGDFVVVAVGFGRGAWFAVGPPGFAGGTTPLPIGGSAPVTLPAGIPLMSMPARYAAASASTCARYWLDWL